MKALGGSNALLPEKWIVICEFSSCMRMEMQDKCAEWNARSGTLCDYRERGIFNVLCSLNARAQRIMC